MQVNKSLSYNMMVFPVHVLNFINLNQSTATSLKKTQKKLESSSCMQTVGGLVSTIIRRYQGSCTLLRYCSSAGWVHEVCPDRDLLLQECVRICVAVVCLLFLLDIFIQITSIIRMWPFLHISGISKHVKFLRHNNLLGLPRETP